MQVTARDERMFEWLRAVRMVEMPDLRWALGGFSGAGRPVSLRKAQQWVVRCRDAGLVASARPSYQAGSVIWGTFKTTGRPAPNLLRQTVRHDLAVAGVAARYVCAGWSWTLDREPERGQHQADGMAVRGDRRELIEVELTAKSRDRYPVIFRSHDERIRFDGITSIVYVTDARTRTAVDKQIQERIFVGDRHMFETIPALDMWGRITQEQWPTSSQRFTADPEHQAYADAAPTSAALF